jgi:hypothetical protein
MSIISNAAPANSDSFLLYQDSNATTSQYSGVQNTSNKSVQGSNVPMSANHTSWNGINPLTGKTYDYTDVAKQTTNLSQQPMWEVNFNDNWSGGNNQMDYNTDTQIKTVDASSVSASQVSPFGYPAWCTVS